MRFASPSVVGAATEQAGSGPAPGDGDEEADCLMQVESRLFAGGYRYQPQRRPGRRQRASAT
jgi:hypothetical protein